MTYLILTEKLINHLILYLLDSVGMKTSIQRENITEDTTPMSLKTSKKCFQFRRLSKATISRKDKQEAQKQVSGLLWQVQLNKMKVDQFQPKKVWESLKLSSKLKSKKKRKDTLNTKSSYLMIYFQRFRNWTNSKNFQSWYWISIN